MCQEKVCKIRQTLIFEHEINTSSAKVFKHYRIVGLFSEYICYDTFAANNLFDLFWNVFNTKVIKVCQTITIYIQNYPVSLY